MLLASKQKFSSSFYFKLSIIMMTVFNASSSLALPLSPGDRLEVSIPKETYFSRVYEVNEEGNLEIPYLGSMAVAGLEPAEIEAKLAYTLVNKGFFPPHTLQMTVQVIEWSPITVNVAGELFLPGAIQINLPVYPEETSVSPDTNQITGEFPYRRYLTDALKAAGGVTPLANIKEIRLIRDDQERTLDLSGAFTGEPLDNIPLIAGDRIIIPPTEDFQAELVRPSVITRPEIEVFVSNLTTPSSGKVVETVAFPYGTRLNQAVIATSCAGGTKTTNAKRKAMLVRVDRLTGKSTYWETGVEDLLRESESDDDNPFLMPKDGVACYDSTVTNIRDIFKSLGDIFNPLRILF